MLHGHLQFLELVLSLDKIIDLLATTFRSAVSKVFNLKLQEYDTDITSF
jgi:hypothetical protein